MARRFAAHAVDSAFNAHYDRPAVLAELGDVDDLAVLDAGCGPGLYAEALVDSGATVTAFDASAAMLELATSRVGDRARLGQAVLGDPLPYADGEFDAAVCALAIHYARDRRAAYAELHRVLRPGGRLVVSTGHPMSDWLRMGGDYFESALVTERWSGGFGTTEFPFWREPLGEVAAAAIDAGFLIDRIVEPRPVDSMRERYPEVVAELEERPAFLILGLVRPD